MPTGIPGMNQQPGTNPIAPVRDFTVEHRVGEVASKEKLSTEQKALLNAAGASLARVIEQSPVALACKYIHWRRPSRENLFVYSNGAFRSFWYKPIISRSSEKYGRSLGAHKHK